VVGNLFTSLSLVNIVKKGANKGELMEGFAPRASDALTDAVVPFEAGITADLPTRTAPYGVPHGLIFEASKAIHRWLV